MLGKQHHDCDCEMKNANTIMIMTLCSSSIRTHSSEKRVRASKRLLTRAPRSAQYALMLL